MVWGDLHKTFDKILTWNNISYDMFFNRNTTSLEQTHIWENFDSRDSLITNISKRNRVISLIFCVEINSIGSIGNYILPWLSVTMFIQTGSNLPTLSMDAISCSKVMITRLINFTGKWKWLFINNQVRGQNMLSFNQIVRFFHYLKL